MSNISLKIKSYFLLVVFAVFLLLPLFSTANAQGITPITGKKNNNAIAKVLCNGVLIIRGNPVKIVASLMVMAVGAGFLLGKIDVKVIIGVALGVAVIFGAPSIYDAVTGDGAGNTGCDGTGVSQSISR
jgi:type IV secretory pathway VirB2 component (pilin)